MELPLRKKKGRFWPFTAVLYQWVGEMGHPPSVGGTVPSNTSFIRKESSGSLQQPHFTTKTKWLQSSISSDCFCFQTPLILLDLPSRDQCGSLSFNSAL